ncbi:spore germination protein [Cohnella faecalis]|uniref:Spore germination protein n=1 Tax=Cohnella faecalis TaxID=2315694 RepID=A0A398CNJ2_9BACL|nr:spore germination protein [Cohnella faecalis]RIE01487.1 spore germination protein [Cohnella faecalis]
MRFPFFRRRKKRHSGSRDGGKATGSFASNEESGGGGDKKIANPVGMDVNANVRWIREKLGDSRDLVVRTLSEAGTKKAHTAFVFLGTMVDEQIVNQVVLQPLLDLLYGQHKQPSPSERFHLVRNHALPVGQVLEQRSLDEILKQILLGNSILFIAGHPAALIAGTTGGESRSVEEPSSQTVIRGPKESFTENFKTNLSLIRRRLKSQKLRIEYREIGTETMTNVAMIYMEGIAQDGIVREVRSRLDRIDTDAILESGYIEEFIQDETFTFFPTMQNTERPDAIAAGLLEGQVALVVDGTPFVLIMPATFTKFFQSSEDYYQRFDVATFLRLIRYGAFFVSMLLPSLYIAVTTFHQEMLPTSLLISLAAQREGVPFPALFEAFLMEITFEVLREAGVRMPRVIGPAISIVGALVLGQAAVQAGLVSAAMVIVVSFTAIANFVIPSLNMSIAARLIRFVMMLLGGTLGLFGIMSGLMVLLTHLVAMRSFGVPYFSPFAPFIWSNWKDVFIRVPQWAMNKRPRGIAARSNLTRQAKGQKPSPSNKG